MALSPATSAQRFNGGTITQPLVVDLSAADGTTVPLTVKASFAAQSDDFFDVLDSDTGHALLFVGPDGGYAANNHTTGALVYEFPQTGYGEIHGGLRTLAIASGALPTVAPVSGTAFQPTAFPSSRDVHLVCPVTFNPTAGAAATCLVELSPDNLTYSTVGTATEPVGVALDGTIQLVSVTVPGSWYVKLTVTNAVLGTGTFY